MIRKWWRWAGRELDWAWNGGRRFWIIAGAVNGIVVGGAAATYGIYYLQAEYTGTAVFWFISAAALFAGATGTNWWLDREQTGGPNSREWRRRKK